MDKKGLTSGFKYLFSPVFTGALFIVFIVAMAVATFIENDYGASSAKQLVYGSKWFELIFVLMVINLVGQIFTFKLYSKKKLTILSFHIAFIIMILGAAITRYNGFEGRVHIREGETVSYALSTDKYMGIQVANSKGDIIYEKSQKVAVNRTSLGEFYRNGHIDNKKFEVRYSRFIPNAVETVIDVAGGEPLIAVQVSDGTTFNELVVLKSGETFSHKNLNLAFNSLLNDGFSVNMESSGFSFNASDSVSAIRMMTREEEIFVPGELVDFEEKLIYTFRGYRIVPQKLSKSGALVPMRADNSMMTGKDAFEIEMSYAGEVKKVYVYDVYNGEATSAMTELGGIRFKASYGPQKLAFPFSLTLEDFLLERYPGSSSPSSYQSNVILRDNEKGIDSPYSIYMNNILKHRGYRFFQSSYDPDEKGTILSMNHDLAGMLVTYTGYAILFLFIILSMLNRNSIFWKVTPSLWRNSASKILGLIALLIILPASLDANPSKIVYNKKKADEFGKVLVQDQKGRTKPLYTLSTDIMRKVNRENSYKGMSPMQVFLGLTTDFQNWQDEPLIKISNRELRSALGITEEYIAITTLVDFNTGTYALSGLIDEVFSKPEAQRSKMDKEVIKVDERVNIIMMIARGEFLKIFPLRDGTENWGTPSQALQNSNTEQDSIFITNILSLYTQALYTAKSTGNYTETDQYLKSIIDYQRAFAGYDLPSEARVNAELIYYKLLIFEKLFPYYSAVGVIMLLVLIVMIIRGKVRSSLLVSSLSILVLAGFLFHTFGLGLRWYISGHSPMSNGYESLLFISWVTVLVGLGFGRKSSLTLAATAVLASLTLMVAHLSFMDPEITNLVPVLKSYWLTLHVSVITASYGFLGLGAILGLVNMILYALNTSRSRKHALTTIDELSVISYRSLTFGLFFLTIGTFLGAVWANESWGRYWGWDPKETWSLITMIVYAFVLHAKNIKGLKSIFAYNVMSVYAFFSVLMTYFGVNYYLSGLHSYAGGDPVPVPSFVYYTVATLIILTIISYRKYARLTAKFKNEE